MNRTLVLSILSEDKPGIVESVASVVNEHDGNWLQSRMTHLAGKFAGIIQVNVAEANQEALTQGLHALESQGILISWAEASNAKTTQTGRSFHFNLMGNDRPGIVREVTQAFAAKHINLEEFHTDCTSMPWSGDPMFTAQGRLQIPEQVDIDELGEQLDTIADQLGVDIELEEPENTSA